MVATGLDDGVEHIYGIIPKDTGYFERLLGEPMPLLPLPPTNTTSFAFYGIPLSGAECLAIRSRTDPHGELHHESGVHYRLRLSPVVIGGDSNNGSLLR
jgi:hypothetical protein